MAEDPCILCGARGSELRWRKDGLDVVRCRGCGLLSRSPLPDREELREIYDASYFAGGLEGDRRDSYFDYLADEDAHRTTAGKRLELLARFGAHPPGRILDVGTAAGFFVDEATKAGWQATGVDVAESMIRHGAEVLGVDVHHSQFVDWDDGVEPRDVVTMWDYIEHTIDPVAEIEKAASVLRPGGLLALSTGDAGSPVARISGIRWHLLTPRHHNYFFDFSTMRRLCEGAGLEVLSIRRRAAHYSLRYLAHKAGLPKRLGDRLGERTVPMSLWDVMTVIARRRA